MITIHLNVCHTNELAHDRGSDLLTFNAHLILVARAQVIGIIAFLLQNKKRGSYR